MPTVVSEAHGAITLPGWVSDLAGFRQWVHRADLPERLKVHFLRGDIWVDLEMEEAFSHNFVKTALTRGLAPVCEPLGIYFCDGMLLTNDEAGIGTGPDAMFVSNETLAAGRVEFASGLRGQNTELVGTPDLVIEIVSPSSVDKDTEWLMAAYHNAGIPEYWLIDAREEDDIRFDIFRRKPKEFVAARKVGGWAKSAVLGKSFRLTRSATAHGYPRFALDSR